MSDKQFTPEHLKKIYDFAVQLGRDAGKMLMDGVEARCGNDTTPGAAAQVQVEKDSSVDIVTQTDEGLWYLFRLFCDSTFHPNHHSNHARRRHLLEQY